MLTNPRTLVKQSNIVVLHCKLYGQCFTSLQNIIFNLKISLFASLNMSKDTG